MIVVSIHPRWLCAPPYGRRATLRQGRTLADDAQARGRFEQVAGVGSGRQTPRPGVLASRCSKLVLANAGIPQENAFVA